MDETGAHIRPEDCLAPTRFIDSDHPAIVAYAARVAGGVEDQVARAVKLYDAVRDDVRYDAYCSSVHADDLVASRCLERGVGFCIAKAVLYAAVSRAQAIPARLGFADVRNHLASKRLLAKLGTDIFVFHGFTEVYLEGRWVAATPAFDLGLCEKFGVKPLAFDGREDSMFHPFDQAGRRHMEYVRKRGAFADVPQAEIARVFHGEYPAMYDSTGRVLTQGDMAAEHAAETGG